MAGLFLNSLAVSFQSGFVCLNQSMVCIGHHAHGHGSEEGVDRISYILFIVSLVVGKIYLHAISMVSASVSILCVLLVLEFNCPIHHWLVGQFILWVFYLGFVCVCVGVTGFRTNSFGDMSSCICYFLVLFIF